MTSKEIRIGLSSGLEARPAAMLVTLAATPATAQPATAQPAGTGAAAPAGTPTTMAQRSIIDPVSGQELIIAFVVEPAVAAAAEPGVGCRSVASAYIIYFPLPIYTELLRWKFNHRWCWEFRQVTSVTVTDALQLKNTTIKMTGSEWKKTISPPPPRNVVRTVLKGMNFQFCPLIGPGIVSCIANFDPVIDVYVSWNGAYVDQSVI